MPDPSESVVFCSHIRRRFYEKGSIYRLQARFRKNLVESFRIERKSIHATQKKCIDSPVFFGFDQTYPGLKFGPPESVYPSTFTRQLTSRHLLAPSPPPKTPAPYHYLCCSAVEIWGRYSRS